MNFCIAGITLSLNCRKEYLHPNLLEFISNDCFTHAHIVITIEEASAPHKCFTQKLITSEYMNVYEFSNSFYITYNQFRGVDAVIINQTTNKSTIYIRKNQSMYATLTRNDMYEISLRDQIFLSIRDIFFTKCVEFNLLPIHSSSIVYNNRVYLFSAPSGTGKTTHTDLWLKHTNATMFNGDVCILEANTNDVIARGIPWCGSSSKFVNSSYPLGEIFFLKRSTTDQILPLNKTASTINLLSRSFASNWTKKQTANNLHIASNITAIGHSSVLECTPTFDALNTVLNHIEGDSF